MALPTEKSGVHLTGADSGWPVAAAAEPSPRKDGTGLGDEDLPKATSVAANQVGENQNEQQTVTITGVPDGGTFTLTFNGQTTAAIAFDASATQVKSALEALSNIAPGDVKVTGSAGGPYTVVFEGAYSRINVAAMTASGASLTGGTTPGVTIATTLAGGAAS